MTAPKVTEADREATQEVAVVLAALQMNGDDGEGMYAALTLAFARHREAARQERTDNCVFCRGIKGNVRGNENVVRGVVCCDDCSMLAGDIERKARKQEREGILWFLTDDPENWLDWDDNLRAAAKVFAKAIRDGAGGEGLPPAIRQEEK